LGFVDQDEDMEIQYSKPMLFAKRPIKYLDSISDNFKTTFTRQNMDFEGNGKVNIVADGYGTLILPNKKYESVLRVKITQNTTTTIKQYGSKSEMLNTTYVWFDNNHTSALLKIDITKSAYYNDKTVQFLIKEKY